jgi:hypothetical protein
MDDVDSPSDVHLSNESAASSAKSAAKKIDEEEQEEVKEMEGGKGETSGDGQAEGSGGGGGGAPPLPPINNVALLTLIAIIACIGGVLGDPFGNHGFYGQATLIAQFTKLTDSDARYFVKDFVCEDNMIISYSRGSMSSRIWVYKMNDTTGEFEIFQSDIFLNDISFAVHPTCAFVLYGYTASFTDYADCDDIIPSTNCSLETKPGEVFVNVLDPSTKLLQFSTPHAALGVEDGAGGLTGGWYLGAQVAMSEDRIVARSLYVFFFDKNTDTSFQAA